MIRDGVGFLFGEGGGVAVLAGDVLRDVRAEWVVGEGGLVDGGGPGRVAAGRGAVAGCVCHVCSPLLDNPVE